MALLRVDRDKCRQDGLCAADCPTGVIDFAGKNSFPELVPGGETMCLRCGHCVAICPHGAMDHSHVPLADCPSIDPALTLSEPQIEQFLRSRRSVRRFKQRTVERDVLQRLIEIARNAPTGSNAQLLEWVVISDRDRLRQLSADVINWMRELLKADPQSAAIPYLPRMVQAWDAGADVILRDAPCLVVAMAPEHDRSGMVNLSLALCYLELTAPVLGLGTCWAGLLQGAMMSHPELKAAVGIPEAYPNHYPMMIGYSKVRYHRLPVRNMPNITWR